MNGEGVANACRRTNEPPPPEYAPIFALLAIMELLPPTAVTEMRTTTLPKKPA